MVSYDVNMRTSATFRIEQIMGFESFYVELLSRLMCSVWIRQVRARVVFVIFFAEDYGKLRFTCARMCAAPRREPHFEKEPPSIPVTVANF